MIDNKLTDKRKWFKFWGQDYLTDMKMLSLSLSDKALWITLLCLGASSDERGVIRNVTEERVLQLSGVTPGEDEWEKSSGFLKKFEELKIINRENIDSFQGETIRIINFNKRQEGQIATDPERVLERVKRYREKKVLQTKSVTPKKVLQKKSVTPDKIRIDKIREDNIIMSQDLRLANLLFDLIKENNPTHKQPNIESWAEEVRKMRQIDKRTEQQIEFLMRWAQNDNFWRGNILSTKKLREKFDQLVMQCKNKIDNNKINIA
jgi:hypothetical protein